VADEPASQQPPTLEQRLVATERMLRVHKSRHTQALANGDEADVDELAKITKLEVQLANLQAYVRLRELTAEPDGAS
jgi:hypothetical protein